MATIDSDAHVIESDETWSYLAGSDRAAAPVLVTLGNTGRFTKFWVIDDRLVSAGPISETDSDKAVRELADVDGRLQQMNEIGTDLQVLYPTMFLVPVTGRPELELALCRCYNRWLADRVDHSGGRLSWALVPPTMTIETAIEEIRFGYEHGACAVFWRGFEGTRLPSDPYFAPLFAEINRFGLAVCVHAANGSLDMANSFPDDRGIWRFKIPGLVAFQAILSSNMACLYPNIRFGFVEFSAQWIPYVVKDFVRRSKRLGQNIDPTALMTENRIFVACQTDDDLDYVQRYAGASQLVAGTDFGHADTASELLALNHLRDNPSVAPDLIERILDHNPRLLYDLR